MKKSIYYIIFIILLYLFLFDPPIFMFRENLRFNNFLILSSVLYHIKKPSFLNKYWKTLHNEVTCFLLILLFVVFRCALEGEMHFITKTMRAFLNMFFVIPFLINYAKSNKFGSEKQVVRALMVTCSIAAIISYICLMNPSFQLYVKDVMIQYSEEDYLYNNEYRGFGIANLMTSNYGYVLGFIAGLGCFYLKENKWFLYCIPLIVFASLINARTSVLITAIVVSIFLIAGKKQGYAFVVLFVGIMFLSYIDTFMDYIQVNDRTNEWIRSFTDQITVTMMTGDVTSSRAGDLLFEKMVFWPDNLEQWILGRGYDIFSNRGGGIKSDNGWIRQLNLGGLFYIALLYGSIIMLFRRLFKNNRYQYMLVFLLTFLIVNTKTSCFPGDSMFGLFFMIYYFQILTPGEWK